MMYPALLAYIGSVHRSKGVGTTLLISIVLAFSILTIAYYSIWHEMQKSKQRLRSTNNQSAAGSYQQRAAQTIQRVLTAFVLTHILMMTRGILMIYHRYHQQWEKENKEVLNNIDVASLIIASLDVIINPIIYFYMQEDIRKELYKIKVIKMILRKRRNETNIGSTEEKQTVPNTSVSQNNYIEQEINSTV